MCNYLQKGTENALEEILPPKFFEMIERSGISSAKQILVLSVWDIKKVTNLSTEDVHFMKSIVANNLILNTTTCDILFELECKNKKVTTGCRMLDDFLIGGFHRGTITEIYGESGSGKTQIGIQAAAHNWSEGSVYICTEDLFPVKRYEQIKNYLTNFNSTIDYGKNTFIEHITEPQDLLSCVRVRLPKLLAKNKLSMVVIDSVAAPFRVECSNYILRAEELRELAISLLKIAQDYNIAVICINQVTAAFNQQIDVLPSLGLAWSNMISTRLWLKKTKQAYSKSNLSEITPETDNNVYVRELSVEFSPHLPHKVAKCIITTSGIKGI